MVISKGNGKVFAKKINKVTLEDLVSFVSVFSLEYRKRKERLYLLACRELLVVDPISKYCTEIIFLYLFSIFKEYSHTSPRITKDIRNSISNCKGNWFEVLRRIASCYWYGYSWSQVAVEDTPFNRKILSEIYTYDPINYDFHLKKGEIEKIIYYETGMQPLEIRADTGIHLVTGVDLSFDYELGTGRVEAALPYWELHKLIMPVLALAGQRQATPILVKKTETSADVILVDQETGLPVINPATGEEVLVKKGWDSVKQLEELGAAGITVIDPDDDLFSIELNVNADFLTGIIKLCEQYRMIAFLVPPTLVSITNSGVGDSGLSNVHLELFQMSVMAMAQFLGQELVEKLFRPIIIYNFGEQSDYGSFAIDEKNPMSLKIAEIAISAIGKGRVELEDIEMLNRIRKILGVPDFIPEELR
jgi:hypothetical protein